MLNKQSLLTAHKKQIEFPPDLSQSAVYPDELCLAVTVNKGQKSLNVESFDVAFSMYNIDGDRLHIDSSIATDYYKEYGYYLGTTPTDYVPSRSDNSQISIELRLPSENQVLTTYQFSGVYVQPLADVEPSGWTVVSTEYDNAIRRLDIRLSYDGNGSLPYFIALVIDLSV